MNVEIRLLNGPHDWGWIHQHIPVLRVEDTCGIVAVDLDKNETIAAMVFDNFLYNSAQMSLVITNTMVLRHGFLEEGANFLFDGCGKDYAYCFVNDKNTPSLQITKHGGFKEKMRIKEGYGKDCDLIVYELKKEDCEVYQRQFRKEVA